MNTNWQEVHDSLDALDNNANRDMRTLCIVMAAGVFSLALTFFAAYMVM